MEEVASHNVFPVFKNEYEDGADDLDTLVSDLVQTGVRYRDLESFDPWSPEGTFLYRWQTIDAGTSTPLLLWLFVQADGPLGEDGLRRSLRSLESFLVRRMVCRATTKDYNRLFLDALKPLRRRTQRGPQRTWRSTSRHRLLNPDTGHQTPSFKMLSLSSPSIGSSQGPGYGSSWEALEDSMRGVKTEEDHVVRKKLTIEHVLPQSWREHWETRHPTTLRKQAWTAIDSFTRSATSLSSRTR